MKIVRKYLKFLIKCLFVKEILYKIFFKFICDYRIRRVSRSIFINILCHERKKL